MRRHFDEAGVGDMSCFLITLDVEYDGEVPENTAARLQENIFLAVERDGLLTAGVDTPGVPWFALTVRKQPLDGE
jgi:hypothetical protein